MTDLADLALPTWAIPNQPRDEAMKEHRVRIQDRWWLQAISSRGLPGTPPAGPVLTRADVWAPTDNVFTLLWRTLAWGSGRFLRLNSRRLDSIQADVPGVERLLTTTAELARADPIEAYSVFRPRNRSEIRWLGPSFFTKYLYFAGGGSPQHPSLILDRVVATALRECGWTSLHPSGAWPAVTYERYCHVLGRWAKEHDCAPDELELTLFGGPGKQS